MFNNHADPRNVYLGTPDLSGIPSSYLPGTTTADPVLAALQRAVIYHFNYVVNQRCIVNTVTFPNKAIESQIYVVLKPALHISYDPPIKYYDCVNASLIYIATLNGGALPSFITFDQTNHKFIIQSMSDTDVGVYTVKLHVNLDPFYQPASYP